MKREFFEYDNACVLIKKIVDDGTSHNQNDLKNVTERHSTYIKPVRDREDYGVGLPEEIRECFLESGKEKLLKKTCFTYTKDGKISKETHFDADDKERFSIAYSYDYLGNITQKKHSAGKEYLYSYDENGNKTREELVGSGFYRAFSYDAANRLIQESEVHTNGPTFTTSYTYDNAGNKTSMTDRFGEKTVYTHDALGRVTKIRHPAMLDKEGTTIFPREKTDYDALNFPEAVTDANDNLIEYERTARGQPALITYPDNSTEKFTYNTNGTLAKKIDRHGVETAYEYDALHRVTKTITSGTKITTHTYSAFHETSSTDPMGKTTHYHYDGAGRLLEKHDGGQKTTYTYDELGRKTSTKEFLKDDSFIETLQSFDLFNRLVEEKTQHSDLTLLSRKKYAYDILDNRTEVKTYTSHDTFHTEYTTYNSQSLPTSSTNALGYTTRYEYNYSWKNELGQKVFKKTTIDPLSNITIEVSDAYHRLDTVEKRSSRNELLAKTIFCYDARGNKTQERELVYADGALLREYVINWTYTPSDLIETCTEQPGTLEEKKTTYTCTRGGLLETIIKPDGVIVSHTYDEFSRLSSIKSSDNTVSYTYSYDLNDNVLSVQDNILNLTHTKSYDRHNRVRKDSLGTGVEISYTYDALDRVTALATCGHDVSYQYQSGRLKNVACASGVSSYTHTYNAFDLRGHVTESSLPASCGTLTQTWDPLGRLEKISSEHFEETCTTFDAAGNLLETIQKDPQGTLTATYSYNDLYQLVSETGALTAAYKNDSLHNRLSKNDNPYTINSLNQLLSDNETNYEYDRNGNPIVVGSMRLSYDALDRLIQLERPGYSRTHYTYDESHRRISKTTFLLHEGSWVEEEHLNFLFFNKREIGSLDTQGNVHEFRTLGLGIGAELGASIALELDGKTFCPLHDHRGNITLLIDTETHQPTDTYRYSAFGEETAFGLTHNPWRFASKRVDPESGFSFFGRRYYSPTVGRFLTPDPIGFADGPNLYAYVHNSPLILVDPYGLFAINPPSVTDPWGHDSWTLGNPDNQPSSFPAWTAGDASNPGATSTQNDTGNFLSNAYDFVAGLAWRTFAPEDALFSEDSGTKKSNARIIGERIGTGIGVLSWAIPLFAPVKAIVTGFRVGSSAARGGMSLFRAGRSFSVLTKESSLVATATKASSAGRKVLGVGKESASCFLKGTRNPVVRESIQRGREAHSRFKEQVEAREREGWRPEPRRQGQDGKWYRPDAMKPDKTYLELKPNSPSGIAAGQRQAANYEIQLERKTEVIYYDSTTGEPLYDLRSMY